MSDNFQDNVSYGASSLSVSGKAVVVGNSGDAGAKSVIFSNNLGAGHFVWNPIGNATISLPNNNGVILLSSQGILSVSAGTTQLTNGQLIFSNSNGMTFGLNGSTITASYTVPSTAGLISAVNVSAGTTSNNLSALTFSNSNGMSFGLNGSTITGSYTVPTQTNQTVGLYALGNTTQNSSTTLDARTLSFNGLGAATVGYSNGSIQISVPTQTAQTQSNIQAIYDGANSISTGTIRFTNANGVSFSVNGQTISGSVAAQTNQTVGLYAVSNTTQNSSTTLDARTLSFQGAGIASVGYSNGSIVVSVPSGGGGLTNVNVSAGTTSNNLSNLVFSNSNSVSFGLNGSTITASIPNQTYSFSDSNGIVWGINASTITASYNFNISAGTTSNNLSSITFSNSNGVSFGLNGSTLTGSVAAQTNQTVGLYAVSNTTQNSSTTLDARTLSFQGAGIASVGYSNGSIVVSVPSGGGGITNINVSAGTTSNNLSAITFSNSNGISFGLNASTVTASHNGITSQTNQTVGLYALGNTTFNSSSTLDARSLSFSGSGNITVGYSNGSIVIAQTGGGGQSNQTLGLYALGNTTQNSSTTLDARTLSFNGLGIITAGYSNGSIQLSATQSAQTQNVVVPSAGTQTATSGTAIFSNSNGITFGMSNSSVITASFNGTLNSVVFSNANNITFGSAGNTTITASYSQSNQDISLFALGNTTQNSSTHLGANVLSLNGLGIVTAGYSNGSIQISASQSVATHGLYAIGNTTGQSSSSTFDARSVSFSGAGQISLGYSGNALVISGNGGGVALSAGANSTSTGTVVFSNSNNITFGMSNNGVVTASFNANNTASTFVLGISTQGNTSGTTGFANQSVQLVGTNGITLSQSINGNSATITLSGDGATLSQFDPLGSNTMVTNLTLGQNSIYFVPFDVPQYLSAYRINFFFSVATTVTASNTNGGGGYTQSAAIYVRDTGTNSTRMTSQWSGSWGISSTVSSNTQINITYANGINNSTSVSTASTGLSTSNATTFPASSIGGFRAVPLPISSTMTPGRYWLAVANSVSSNASYAVNCSVMQYTLSNNIAFRPFGTSSAASNASFYAIKEGMGTYSATSGAFPGTVILNSDSIRAGLTASLPYFNFSGYTTATNMI